MARIYEILSEGLWFIPTVRSDDEGWQRAVCKHKHFSYKEALKCLTRALPKYMKYQKHSKRTMESNSYLLPQGPGP